MSNYEPNCTTVRNEPLAQRPDSKFYAIPADVWSELLRRIYAGDMGGALTVASLNAKRMCMIVSVPAPSGALGRFGSKSSGGPDA